MSMSTAYMNCNKIVKLGKKLKKWAYKVRYIHCVPIYILILFAFIDGDKQYLGQLRRYAKGNRYLNPSTLV